MSAYFSEADLGEPAVLAFRAGADAGQLTRDIRRLAGSWGVPAGAARTGREDWLRAWRNIRALADRVLSSEDADGRCDPEAFHHLVMAVGNFKRQAGDIHLPVELSAPAAGGAASGLILPGCGDRIERGTADSWPLLGRIPGLGGIPTASCVLAALWPDCHVIMDMRDRRAAVGLHVGRRIADDRRLNTLRIPSRRWWFYDWFRSSVTATAKAASVSPAEVERALFVLDACVGYHLPAGWSRTGTWATYHALALEQVDREPE